MREKRLPAGEPREYDAAYYHHQLPGGMVTTTQRMLEEIRRPELFDAVLDEVVRVRAEMGYPILVTPVSQLIAYQATRNVIDSERWLNVSDETVRYFLGHYGEFAAPPDPDVADRVLSLPKVDALRDAHPVSLDGARARFGERISEEELLLRLTMPAEQVDAMRAAPPIADKPLGAPVSARAPIVRLLREVERRRSISYLRVRKGDDLVVWRRALDRVRAFVFDIDGTLVHRAGPEEVHAIPGARDVLDRVAASGRPFAVFTNGSHVAPDAFARRAAGRRAAGRGRAGDHAALLRAGVPRAPERRARAADRDRAGARVSRGFRRAARRRRRAPADAVFVAHPARADFDELERAARAVLAGARLLTGSYVPAYAGANGPILSRGAMLTAAIAKASGARPIVVGKPSRAAVRELSRRLGVPSQEVAVVGDDFGLDVALGRLGDSTTVLVRSGISASLDLARIPETRRPDHTIGSVAELLGWL